MCSRGGKIIFARLFCDMLFGRLETLLNGFPRLLKSGQQHTFIEVDSLRYIYHPLEDYYIILLTNRSSNIISDMKTMSLCSAAASQILKGKEQKEFSEDDCFQLILSFDEISSRLGTSVINQEALNDVLMMESNEEAVQEAILQVKTANYNF